MPRRPRPGARVVSRAGAVALAALAAPGCGTDFLPEACRDGFDNDNDTIADWPDDPGCYGPFDRDEKNPGECGDGVDNDRDGRIDWPADPACITPASPSEALDPRQPSACDDGVDNDRDGKIDYPRDPGCITGHDDDEADPGLIPACGDGKDNDGDGLTDYPADPGCESTADPDETDVSRSTCGSNIQVVDISQTGEATGEIRTRRFNAITGSCGGLGAELAYRYVLGGSKRVDLVASTDILDDRGALLTTLDTVVYIRTDCRAPDSELDCNDDAGPTTKASRAVAHDAAPGTYYVIVDSFNPGSLGTFRLKITPTVAKGSACDPASMTEKCSPGLTCRPPLAGLPPTCEEAVCSDGRDNDGDGRIDYPNDPGCVSAADGSEEDPSPLPECADGRDNDGDGRTDFPADPGCAAASDDNERDECVPFLTIRALTWTGATGTTAGPSRVAGGCSFFTGSAPEDVYVFQNDRAYSTLTFSTESPDTRFDTVVYVRSPSCDSAAAEKVCNDDAGGKKGEVGYSRATIAAPQVGPYYVFVDGNAASGLYRLVVTATVAAGERCDPISATVGCNAGFGCKGAPGAETCQKAACSDAVDNDGDGRSDFPADPGCTGISDDDESDPSPLPACGNGRDDDADGKADFPADPGCSAASDGSELDLCNDSEVETVPPGGLVRTMSTRLTGAVAGSCGPAGVPSTYPEQVFGLVVAQDLKALHVSTDHPETTLDTVLYLRRDACLGGTEVACNDDASGDAGSAVTLFAPIKTSYYIIVDSKPPATSTPFLGGPFKLTVAGEIARGNPCDPADVIMGCESGSVCQGGTGGGGARCAPARCANGIDDDGDGRTDYPADPGCLGPSDDDEPDPTSPPTCADGLDNDGDGRADYPADLGCEAASGASEVDLCGGAPLGDISESGLFFGTTAGRSRFTPPCKPVSRAPEAVAGLSIPGDLRYLRATTSGSAFDTVLTVRSGSCSTGGAACGGPPTDDIAATCCNDDRVPGDSVSELTLTDRPAGRYFLFVDGHKDAASSSGAFRLTVTGELLPGAACDPLQTAFIACPAGQACARRAPGHACQ